MIKRISLDRLFSSFRKSVVTRIVWVVAVPFVVAAILSGVLVHREYSKMSIQVVEDSLIQDMSFYRDALILAAAEDGAGDDACISQELIIRSQIGMGEGAFAFVQDGCADNNAEFDPENYAACFDEICTTQILVNGQHQKALVHAISLGGQKCREGANLSLPGPPGCLYAWSLLDVYDAKNLRLGFTSLFLIGVPTILSLLLSIYFSDALKSEINSILKGLTDFAKGDRKAKIDVKSDQNEIGQLAKAANATLRSVEKDLIASARMSASLSHQLLTPIRDVRARVVQMREHIDLPAVEGGSGAGRADAQYAQNELDYISVELGHIVKTGEALQRLLLAKRKRTADELNELVDLYDVCEITAIRYRQKAAQRSMRILVEADTVDVRSNVNVVTELLRIFLDNAIIYGPRDSAITVFCRARGKQVVIGVKDEGDGPPASVLDEVFNEEFSAETTHSARAYAGGNGIGLMTARQLADNCHMSIAQRKLSPRGWEVELCFASPELQNNGT